MAIQQENFWLEFQLEKSLEFWLEILYTKKKFKIMYFRHVTESKWHLNPFFKPNLTLKLFLLNCRPGPRHGRPRPAGVPRPRARLQGEARRARADANAGRHGPTGRTDKMRLFSASALFSHFIKLWNLGRIRWEMTSSHVYFVLTVSFCSRVANDHDRDQIFGLDCPIPTDFNRL